MGLALYLDHHVPRAIAIGLRMRGVDVLTAYEDSSSALSDPELLDRASELKRVLFTQDDDLVIEAVMRQRARAPFCGVIYAHQLRVTIGVCVQQLEMIAKAAEPGDLMNGILFLPL